MNSILKAPPSRKNSFPSSPEKERHQRLKCFRTDHEPKVKIELERSVQCGVTIKATLPSRRLVISSPIDESMIVATRSVIRQLENTSPALMKSAFSLAASALFVAPRDLVIRVSRSKEWELGDAWLTVATTVPLLSWGEVNFFFFYRAGANSPFLLRVWKFGRPRCGIQRTFHTLNHGAKSLLFPSQKRQRATNHRRIMRYKFRANLWASLSREEKEKNPEAKRRKKKSRTTGASLILRFIASFFRYS